MCRVGPCADGAQHDPEGAAWGRGAGPPAPAGESGGAGGPRGDQGGRRQPRAGGEPPGPCPAGRAGCPGRAGDARRRGLCSGGFQRAVRPRAQEGVAPEPEPATPEPVPTATPAGPDGHPGPSARAPPDPAGGPGVGAAVLPGGRVSGAVLRPAGPRPGGDVVDRPRRRCRRGGAAGAPSLGLLRLPGDAAGGPPAGPARYLRGARPLRSGVDASDDERHRLLAGRYGGGLLGGRLGQPGGAPPGPAQGFSGQAPPFAHTAITVSGADGQAARRVQLPVNGSVVAWIPTPDGIPRLPPPPLRAARRAGRPRPVDLRPAGRGSGRAGALQAPGGGAGLPGRDVGGPCGDVERRSSGQRAVGDAHGRLSAPARFPDRELPLDGGQPPAGDPGAVEPGRRPPGVGGAAGERDGAASDRPPEAAPAHRQPRLGPLAGRAAAELRLGRRP